MTLTYDWSAVPAHLREYIHVPPSGQDHLENSLQYPSDPAAQVCGPAAKRGSNALAATWFDSVAAMDQITTVEHVVAAVRELSRERPVVIAQDIALEFDIDYVRAVDLLGEAVRQDQIEVAHVVVEWSYDDEASIEYDVYRPSDPANR